MIVGIGLDVTEVARMERHCEDMQFLKKLLHPDELTELLSSSETRAQLLASRFAVKEAFSKAVGTGMRGLRFVDIQLSHDELGKPHLILHGKARNLCDNLHADEIFVSLSHEKSVSAAVVILERRS